MSFNDTISTVITLADQLCSKPKLAEYLRVGIAWQDSRSRMPDEASILRRQNLRW